MSYLENMLFLFHKKYFSEICLIFEWIRSKNFFSKFQQNFCFVLFPRHKVRIKSIQKMFLEQQFTQACMYYSVIQSKAFSSLSSL